MTFQRGHHGGHVATGETGDRNYVPVFFGRWVHLVFDLLKDGTGRTRDISTSGIFFETDTAYSVGESIGLSVDFKDATSSARARRAAGTAS